jgi:hypothetical protein
LFLRALFLSDYHRTEGWNAAHAVLFLQQEEMLKESDNSHAAFSYISMLKERQGREKGGFPWREASAGV